MRIFTSSIQRKCCNTSTLNAARCQSVDWKPIASNNVFNVAAYANKNLHCVKDDAIVRDVKVKNLQE